ncbi:MAG: lipoprotein, partial [Pseudomonadota bacterium]
MRKSSIVLVLACLVLTGCGLRGGLVRPDPIFRDVAPIEDVMDDEIAAEEPLVLEEPTGPRVNDFGGEIPEA